MSADVSEAVARIIDPAAFLFTDDEIGQKGIAAKAEAFEKAERILAALQEGSGALPASPSAGQWQPIETAPKDGSVFVAIALSRHGELYDSRTFKPFGCWWSKGGEFSPPGWAREVHGFRSFGNHTAHPTHWMPLPDAPSMGMEPKAECAQPSRSDILERIRAFDLRAHYGEPEYERLADDLEALAQPNQPRDREEG